MICETCSFDCVDSCAFYNNEMTTHLLCILKKIPNDIIYYITEYMYHYQGHKVLNYNEYKTLCTSCFQLGYYKLVHSNKIITGNNIIHYFDCWMGDDIIYEIKSFFLNLNIPYVMDIIAYYDNKLKLSSNML